MLDLQHNQYLTFIFSENAESTEIEYKAKIVRNTGIAILRWNPLVTEMRDVAFVGLFCFIPVHPIIFR